MNPNTGLPEEETAELQTSVMLEDGYGTVIGGLLQEKDSIIQSKIPFLGDLWLVGRLFQREKVIKSRSEIIIVLIPRVLPYNYDYAAYEQGELHRTGTDLFEGPLLRKRRPWAPQLPDAIRNPRVLRLPPIGHHYPWPAGPHEQAATPQIQDQYDVPPKPRPLYGPYGDAAGDFGWPIDEEDSLLVPRDVAPPAPQSPQAPQFLPNLEPLPPTVPVEPNETIEADAPDARVGPIWPTVVQPRPLARHSCTSPDCPTCSRVEIDRAGGSGRLVKYTSPKPARLPPSVEASYGMATR